MADAINVVGIVIQRPVRVVFEVIVISRLGLLFRRWYVVCHSILSAAPATTSLELRWLAPIFTPVEEPGWHGSSRHGPPPTRGFAGSAPRRTEWRQAGDRSLGLTGWWRPACSIRASPARPFRGCRPGRSSFPERP